jgi:membrane protein
MTRRLRLGWTVLRRAVAESRNDDVGLLAQALAYSLFLAIPAAALVVLGVFSIVADDSAVETLVERAEAVMPEEAAVLLRDSLERSAGSTGSGVVMTAAGLVLALWTTTSAAATLLQGISRAFDQEDQRSFLRRRLLALLVVLALVFSATLVVTLLVLGPHLERWLGAALDAEDATAWVWWTAQWPFLVAGLLFAFGLVLYLGPDDSRQSWRQVLPGAAVAAVVWLLASAAFAFYAASFGSYNKSWGALSAVVVTLVWLWLTSAALLFGAEVNAEARRVRDESRRADETSRPPFQVVPG